jgi:hypothetical protein
MPLIYKTLFEVRLLHEFYLTKQDGATIFEKLTQQERETFLNEEFAENRDPVNDDIRFLFPQTLLSKYESYNLKVLPAYSGFRVSVRVREKKLPDQSTVYEPLVPLTDDLHIFILALRKNPRIDTYTNTRMSAAIKPTYFFSNADVGGSKTFPFLTNDIPAQNSSFVYEQGELSLNGASVQEFYRQGNTDVFRNVTGNGFANESDRVLLGGRFNYFFPDINNLTQATFVLKDVSGNELTTITKNDAAGMRERIAIDFGVASKQLPIETPFNLDQQFHTLEVSGNNGYSAIHKIIFSDALVQENPWAVFDISTSVTNAAFNLFAHDGFIFRRKDPLGIWSPAPVFEVPVKSRLAYWRYINSKGRELNISAGFTNYLDKEGKVLVTKTPRSLAKAWFLLREEGTPNTTYAPNPIDPTIRLENDRRAFFDIRVPNSDSFPEA